MLWGEWTGWIKSVEAIVLKTVIHQKQAIADTFGQAAIIWDLPGLTSNRVSAGGAAWVLFRHSAITAALDATDGNVRKVQKLSRHRKLDTLMIYDDNRHKDQGEITDLLDGMF